MIRSILTAALIAVFAVDATAEVTRVDVTRRAHVGTSGYEKVVGTIHFAIDPKHKDNAVIVGLDQAPLNAAGLVEFSADLYILQPREASRSNGVALVDVVNRGRKMTLSGFSLGGALDPETEADLGDGFLTRLGYTLVWVGWQFDVPRVDSLMGIAAPHAMGVTTTVRAEFTPHDRNPNVTVTDLAGYPVIGDGRDASLTVRDGPFGEPEEIPREEFRLLAGHVVSMDGGFEPGRRYQLSYRTESPAIAGVGLAAVRDTASWLKRDPSAPSHPRYTIAFGSSQGGRFLRTLLYQGFNTDERGRQVFDGVIAHLAGAARLSVNEEGATPNSLGLSSTPTFPFTDTVQKDLVTGKKDGLLENARARGHAPKVFYTNSSAEYWSVGRAAAFIHTLSDPSGFDEKLPANVRVYLFAGTQHSPGAFPPQKGTAQQQLENPVEYRWSMRALLVAMTRWVKDAGGPPTSRYPRSGFMGEMQDTMANTNFISILRVFPRVPDALAPDTVMPGRNRFREYTPLQVSDVDRTDGNELAGIRLPDVEVPLATYTGWNFRTPEVGAPNELAPLTGSMLPFAATEAQRIRNHDPRVSLEELYKSKDDYLQKIRKAAGDLVKDRYLLADDVAPIVERAAETWDWVVSAQAVSSLHPLILP